jgi:hypothetical protein
MKIFNKVRSEFFIAAAITLMISVTTSVITYQIVIRKVPQIAVVDLLDLQNQFSIDLARYLSDHEVGDEKMTEVVKAYTSNLEMILKDISQSGKYLLLQKQTVVSEDIPDITADVKKALFESVMYQTNLGAKNEKNQ